MSGQIRIGVVMAGGSGERFWPLSTATMPKQLLNLTHPSKNMLQEALERLEGVVDEAFVSTTVALAPHIVASEVVAQDHILAEPCKRNTLGALVWVVAELIARGFESATVAVVTADHFIGEPEKFGEVIEAALELAASSRKFVTLGIRPTRPETGYGYIEFGKDELFGSNGHRAFKSVAFTEKPDAATANLYLRSERHLWNSGMFFFSVGTFLDELSQVQPGARASLDSTVQSLKVGNSEKAKASFECVENMSIDYAVMERVPHVLVIPVDFPWDDVGAWDSLLRTDQADGDGNAVRGLPELVEVANSIIVEQEGGIRLSVLGVTDLIIVASGNEVMICHRDHAQRVRELARRASDRHRN